MLFSVQITPLYANILCLKLSVAPNSYCANIGNLPFRLHGLCQRSIIYPCLNKKCPSVSIFSEGNPNATLAGDEVMLQNINFFRS